MSSMIKAMQLEKDRDEWKAQAEAEAIVAGSYRDERDELAAHVEVLASIINNSDLTDRPHVMSALNSLPDTSLARLKAQWRAEELESLADLWEGDSPCTVEDEGGATVTIWTGWLRERAEEIHRQVGGDA